MSSKPFQVVRDFESALCDYTGAKYAVTTTSCTMAVLLACALSYQRNGMTVMSIPRLTYVGIPASIVNAGLRVVFHDELWEGEYELRNSGMSEIWDSARRFTAGMYRRGAMQCLSFHWGKILGLGQGGAILHNDQNADAWLRRARFDGRTEGVDPRIDQVQYPSWHAYMAPETAAHGLVKLALLPKHNADLPRSDYPDLSKLEVFR